jgi:putative transcriptional regulator
MKISAQHVFKSKAQPKQGHLLLADPHLTEAFFERAVILLVAHDQSESFGLVLNHKSELVLSDLFEHIELDLPIFNGGPVAPEQLFYLHRFAGIDGASQVTENLFFGGDWKEVLMRAHLLPKPQEHLRLFAGYAGWGPEQLVDDKALLKEGPAQLWKTSMLQQGPELALFAHFPLNVSDN